MKVLDLRCSNEHAFEGWFGSEDDFQQQLQRGLVQCPMCGVSEVHKVLSAPRLNLSQTDSNKPKRGQAAVQRAIKAQEPVAPVDPAAQEILQKLHTAWMRTAREIVEKTEDVGERFAEEARRIHYGDAPERGIRGQASVQEREALAEEGIEVMTLPMPPGVDETLQ